MKHRLLVCDDTLFVRSVISEIAESAGYDVVGTATTGTEAVEMAKTLKPDLITMDVVMPELSGIDAARLILERDTGVRILMCSALGQEKLVAQALEAGTVGYVVKPFNSEQLVSAMKIALSTEQPA